MLLGGQDLEIDFLTVFAVEEEGCTCAVDAGSLHADSEAPVQHVVPLTDDLCAAQLNA